MLDLLLKSKAYAYWILILALCLYNGFEHSYRLAAEKDRDKLMAEYAQCQAEKQQFIATANYLRSRQEERLKLMEKEAEQRARLSEARMEQIKKATPPRDCDGAFRWLIERSR